MGNSGHLSTLITTLTAERGWSLRELARRANLPAPTVQKIASHTAVTMPRRDTLEALARGLGVPLSVLLDAASQDAGITTATVTADDNTRVVIAALEELPPERRAEVAVLVMAMLNGERARRQ